tara:strand:- start:1640 stop:1891 length:252 start_codon:yes stop_codon:yes gene_type:complete
VKGKGGLIRDALIPNALATQLEQRRLAQPITVRDREINYLQRYDIVVVINGHAHSQKHLFAHSFFLMAVMASGIATHKREWMN